MSVFSDFDWSWRGVRVRETGAEIAFNPALAWDVWRGGHYIVREALRRPAPQIPLRISYAPRAPRPWYLLWGALRQAGLTRKTGDPGITLHFSDLTHTESASVAERTINGRCTDISKSHVAQVFQSVFWFILSLDPSPTPGPYL